MKKLVYLIVISIFGACTTEKTTAIYCKAGDTTYIPEDQNEIGKTIFFKNKEGDTITFIVDSIYSSGAYNYPCEEIIRFPYDYHPYPDEDLGEECDNVRSCRSNTYLGLSGQLQTGEAIRVWYNYVLNDYYYNDYSYISLGFFGYQESHFNTDYFDTNYVFSNNSFQVLYSDTTINGISYKHILALRPGQQLVFQPLLNIKWIFYSHGSGIIGLEEYNAPPYFRVK